MEKFFILTIVAVVAGLSSFGQSKTVCNVTADKAATSCYVTKFAENYKVCHTEKGYYICGKKTDDNEGMYNFTTLPPTTSIAEVNQDQSYKVGAPELAAGIKTSKRRLLIENKGSGATRLCKRSTKTSKPDCYDTHYAQNFDVCHGGKGYYICDEVPNRSNSTFAIHSQQPVVEAVPEQVTSPVKPKATIDPTVPQNQSYENISPSSR